jgi:hypothetical protein
MLKGIIRQHAGTTCSSGDLSNTPYFDDIRMTRKEGTASLQWVSTKLISPIIHNHIHFLSMINDMWTSKSKGALSEQQGNGSTAPRPLKRTYALYFESDEDTNDEEQLQGIDNVLANIHSCYSAMNFLQYMKTLKEHGIFYLSTTMHFNSRFYVEKVGMSEGTAFTFHSGISKAHMKGRCAKARKKGKGKNKA